MTSEITQRHVGGALLDRQLDRQGQAPQVAFDDDLFRRGSGGVPPTVSAAPRAWWAHGACATPFQLGLAKVRVVRTSIVTSEEHRFRQHEYYGQLRPAVAVPNIG